MWKGTDWLKLDEDAIIWIVSQNTLFHSEAHNVGFGITSCQCGLSFGSSNTVQKLYESKNEVLIFGKVIE